MNELVKTGNPLETLLKRVPKIYKYSAARFVRYVTESGMNAGDPETWKEYLASLKKKQAGRKRYAAATVNVSLCAMKKVLRLALKSAVFTMTAAEASAVRDELDELKGMKKPQPRSYVPAKVMTAEEVVLLIEKARQPIWGEDHRTARPDVALWLAFLWQTGFRVSEMTGILLTDLQRTNGHFQVRVRGKGAKEGFGTVDAGLIEQITAHFGSEEYLFEHRNVATGERHPYTAGHVSMAIHRLGWTVLRRRISAHALRHSIATHLYTETKDIVALQHFLRHSNVATTLNYYSHSEFDTDKLATMVKLPTSDKTGYPTGSAASLEQAPIEATA